MPDAARWGRRATWLAADTIRSVRGVARALRRARRRPTLAVALLEGAAAAVAGRPNAYHARVVNDGPQARPVTLAVTVDRAGCPPALVSCTLAPHTSRDLFFVVDWAGCCEATDDPPPDPPHDGRMSTSETCSLTAALRVGAQVVERLTITQPLLR